ncbi:MAG: hypothetical protein FJ091_06885 [Deltaproteobacteria bacterium]|nr:hypothetical protein [Deltaproteobacteria bacterium]
MRALALASALLASACVSGARDDMQLARDAYERCVAAEGERACTAQKERMLAAERAYAEQAQRAWGCSPAHADCPPRR